MPESNQVSQENQYCMPPIRITLLLVATKRHIWNKKTFANFAPGIQDCARNEVFESQLVTALLCEFYGSLRWKIIYRLMIPYVFYMTTNLIFLANATATYTGEQRDEGAYLPVAILSMLTLPQWAYQVY